jgi:hypothetical protein
MAVPDYQSLMLPLLQFAGERDFHNDVYVYRGSPELCFANWQQDCPDRRRATYYDDDRQ